MHCAVPCDAPLFLRYCICVFCNVSQEGRTHTIDMTIDEKRKCKLDRSSRRRKKKGQAIGNSLIQETGSDIHHCRRIQISWIQEARGIKTEKNRSEGNQWKSKKGETLS